MDKIKLIAFRVSVDEARKLAELACKSERNVSEVLRLLVRQAVLSDRPDVTLVPHGSGGQADRKDGEK